MDVHKKFIAVWIADLFKFDIVPSSYIPSKDIRKLRELFRYRYKLVNERSSEKMRLQNALTVSNIALGSVLTPQNNESAGKKRAAGFPPVLIHIVPKVFGNVARSACRGPNPHRAFE